MFEPNSPRLVSVSGINVEAPLAGTLLIICNDDQPGVIGEVGTILGRLGVNIANFALGRNETGAMGVVNVDEEASKAGALDAALRRDPEDPRRPRRLAGSAAALIPGRHLGWTRCRQLSALRFQPVSPAQYCRELVLLTATLNDKGQHARFETRAPSIGSPSTYDIIGRLLSTTTCSMRSASSRASR